MAFSKCGSCGKGFFQIVEKEPSGSNFKLMFVQCSACGVPVGVTDFYNVNKQIKDLNARMDTLESLIKTIDQNIRIIASNMR